MPRTRAYFHDRLILLILSINTFLGIILIISTLMPLSDSSAGYIREYRSNLSLDGYLAGEVRDIVSFAVFAVIVYIFMLISSIKIYHIHKRFSIVILLLAMLCFIFGLLVSNALLGLR